LGLLACLDDAHRLAFVLGEILGLDHAEASEVQDITPAAHRKRVSRARAELRTFLSPRCSVVNPDAPCRCAHQVPLNVRLGRLKPETLPLGAHCDENSQLLVDPSVRARAHDLVRDLGGLVDAVELFRHQPAYAAPARLREAIHEVLASHQN
jgi:hypothetical protein